MDSTHVPAGYKLTDLGVLPEEWQVKTLGEIASIDNDNLNARTPQEYAFDYVSLEDVNTGVLSGTTRYKFSEAPSRARRKLEKGDVLVATVRPNLKSHFYIQAEVKDLICSTGFAVVRCNKQVANPQYVYNHVFADIVNNQINMLIGGSNYPAISNRDVKKLSIPLPPLAEQQAIAAALGEMDALLAAQRARLAKQRAVKQGLLQGLLSGQQRLPGFAGEWEVKRLGEVLKFQVGCPFSSTYFNQAGDGLRLIKNRDLKSDDSIYYYSGPFGSEFVVQDDDVLIGMDGDFLPCLWNKGKALLNQRVGRIVTNSKADRTFCYYVLAKPLQDIQTNTGATTVKHLSHKDIESISLPLPEITEQRAIAAVLSEADAYLAALEAEHAKTQLLKQGMMQNLLTGKLRLV